MINKLQYAFILLSYSLLSSLNLVSAQDAVWMQSGQTDTIDARTYRNGFVYDNGGPQGNYSNNFSGTVVIDAGSSLALRMFGLYTTENNYDKISIWDGDNQNGTLVYNNVSGSGNVDITSQTGKITIQFTTDGSVNNTGFEFQYVVTGIDCEDVLCNNSVYNIILDSVSQNTASISWNAYGSAPFYLRLNNQLVDTVSDSSYTFTNLFPNSLYSVSVSTDTNISPCCHTDTVFRTDCGGIYMPLRESFDEYGYGYEIFPTCWTLLNNYDGGEPGYVSNDAYVSYPASLRLSTTTAERWVMAISPEVISHPINTLSVKLKLRAPYSNTRLEIGVCDDTTLWNNNFVPIDTLTLSSANTWREYVVSLSGYVGSGKHVAFRVHRNLQAGDNYSIYIDDISIETCGLWNVSLYQRNAYNIWLTWTEYGNPANVNVEYGPTGFNPGDGVTINGVSSPLHISNLVPQTTYEFRLYPYCSDSVPPDSFINHISSTLEYPQNMLELCEDFDQCGSVVPTGWRYLNRYNNTPQTSTTQTIGTRSMRMRPNGTSIQPTLILPMIDTVCIQSLNVEFSTFSQSYSSGCIVVGVLEFPEKNNSWIAVDTVFCSQTNVWMKHQVSLSNYQGNGKYIALRVYDPSTNYNDIYIDNIKISPCLLNNVYITNIESDQVEIRWDLVNSNYHGDSVIVEYGPTGFSVGTGTVASYSVRGDSVSTIGSQQRVVISNLTPDTEYQFVVHGLCDTTSNYCNSIILSAHTLGQDILLPYCIDFEGISNNGYPLGWQRASVYDYRPRVTTGSRARSGSSALNMHAYGNLDFNHSTAVLPILEVDSLNGLIVSFYSYGTSNTSYVQVGVIDNPNDDQTFSPLYTSKLSQNKWKHHICEIRNYTGTGRYIAIRYYHTSNYSCYEAWFDDIIVNSAGVYNQSVHSISSHGGIVTWDFFGRSYVGAEIEFGVHGFTRGEGDRDTVAYPFNTYTLDTLSNGVSYDVYITALSSETEDVCNNRVLTFFTIEQPTNASYCNGFENESVGARPDNWTELYGYNGTPKVSNEAYSGNFGLHLCNDYSCSRVRTHCYAIMPYLEEDSLDGLQLRFYAKGSCVRSELNIGIMTDPTDSASFQLIQTVLVNHTNEWREYVVDLDGYTGTGRHITFFYRTTSQSPCTAENIYIDNITINRCRLDQVRVFGETSNSVSISWSPSVETDSVEVEYGPAGFSEGSGIVIVTDSNFICISELVANTVYDFYLRPYCSNSSHICSNDKYTFLTTLFRVKSGYCNDFEVHDGNGSLPPHYHRPIMQDNWPSVKVHSSDTPDYYTSPLAVLEFCADSNGSNMMVMPAAEEPLDSLVVSFNMRSESYIHPEWASLIVGVMPNPYDTAQFIPIDTVHPSFFYQRYDVSLNSYTGDWRHIAFKYLDNNRRVTCIDDILLSHCRPSNIRSQMLTDNSVTLTWNRIGYSDTTIIEYGLNGFSLGEGIRVTSTDTVMTINNLYADTTYTFMLWGGCGDTLIECQALLQNIHTLDEPVEAPICFDFENNGTSDIPNGWTRVYGSNESGITNETNRTLLGGRSMQLYASNCNNVVNDRTNMIAMPWILSDSVDDLWLDFYAKSNDNISLIVGYLTNLGDSSTFIAIDTIGCVDQWRRSLYNISTYLDDIGHNIAFKSYAENCNEGYVYIDDISIRTCAITNAVAGWPTHTSLTLSFQTTSNCDGVWVEYHAVGGRDGEFTPGTGDTVFLTTSPYTFEGLSQATWYAFYIYPDCSGSDMCNPVIVKAQTLHPAMNIPFCENFDPYDSGIFMNNWRRMSTDDPNSPVISSELFRSTDNSLLFTSSSVSAYTMAVMPQLLVSPSCLLVDSLFANFWIQFTDNWENSAFIVGTITDPNNANTFSPIDTIRASSAGSWTHHTVPIRNFSSTNTFVAYKYISLNGQQSKAYIDDLCMEKCIAANLSIDSVTQSSVTVTWDDLGVDSLVCEYGPPGFAAGTGTTAVFYSSPSVIEGLDNGTEYEFAFSSVCNCSISGAIYPPGGGSSGTGGGSGGGWRDTTITHPSCLRIPYCESFESYDTLGFPPSWRRDGSSHDGYPAITTRNNHSGNASLVFYATPGTSNYATIAPVEEGILSNLVLSFYAYSTNENATNENANFIVGVMSNPDNPETFEAIDTIRLDTVCGWEQFIITFDSYVGEAQYIAFLFSPVNASYHYYIDDLYIGTCAISDVQIQTGALSDLFGDNYAGIQGYQPNLIQDSLQPVIRIDYLQHNNPDRIMVMYGPQGFVAGDSNTIGTGIFTPDSTIMICGLDPTGSYDFYVSAICDDTAASCFVNPITMNSRLYTPYCEFFDNIPDGTLPVSWKVLRRNNYRQQYPVSETFQDRNVVTFYPYIGANDNVVLLPQLPDGDSLQGKWVHVNFAASRANYIYLDFGTVTDTNNAATFVSLGTVRNSSVDVFKNFNVQLRQSGQAYNRFAIRARSTSGENWIKLDQIAITDFPYPLSINSRPLGARRQMITWSGANNNPYYTIEYGYDGTWDSISSDSCQVILNDLQPGTTYTVYFISPSGERLCMPYSFTTEDFLDLGYCEDFESQPNNVIPDGWYSYNTRYSDYFPATKENIQAYSGQKSLQFYNRGSSSSSAWNTAVLPDIAIDSLNQAFLKFKLFTTYNTGNMMVVGVQDDKYDPNSFVPVDTAVTTNSQQWQEFVIPLEGYSGHGRYISFRYVTTTGSSHYAYIDDLEITQCAIPVITVAGANMVKCEVPVTTNTPVNYYIEYGEGLYYQGQVDTIWSIDSSQFTLNPRSNIVHVTTNPYYLTGLNEGSQYSFYVKCDEDEVVCGSPVIITTAPQIPIPYCDNFDGYDNLVVPDGWYSYSSYGDNYPRTYNYDYNSCCRTLDFYSNRNNLQYTALPDIDVDSIRYVDMYFSLKISNVSHTRLVVGVMDNRTDIGTFTPIDTLSCSTNSNHEYKHVSFSNYNGDGRFIAFKLNTTNSARTSIFLDDLYISEYQKPLINLIDATTVLVQHTDDREPDYWIEYGPQGTVQGDENNTFVHITSDSVLIEHLDPLTTYDFYHHSDSSGVSCFPYTRITTSISLEIPYCDAFDDYPRYSCPTNWVRYMSRSGYDYPRVNNSSQLEFYCYGNDVCQISTPALDIDSLKNIELYFDMMTSYPQYSKLVIGVMSDINDLSTFVGVDTINNTSSSEWKSKHVSLRTYRGNGKFLTFRMLSTSGWRSLYIDNLYIQSCPRPSIQVIDATTALVSLDTIYAPDYWLEYGPQGMVRGQTDTIWTSDTNFILQPHNQLLHVTVDSLIIELEENSVYDFYPRCDSALNSSCYTMTQVTSTYTETVPYCEYFDTYEGGGRLMPVGWYRYTTQDNNGLLCINSLSSANNGLRFYTNNGQYAYAVLPVFDVASISELHLILNIRSDNPSQSYLEIGVMSNSNDIETFEAVGIVRNTIGGTWEQFNVSLENYSGEGRFIAIRKIESSGSRRSIYLDWIRVLSCEIPIDARPILHSHNSVRIDASMPTLTGFWAEYGTTDFELGTGSRVWISEIPTVIELENNTSYQFYFYCDQDNPGCAFSHTVTTLLPPVEPPYCQGFENHDSSLPLSWTTLNTSGNSSISIDSTVVHDGSYSCRFRTQTGRPVYAVMPYYDIDTIQNLTIQFWMKGAEQSSVTIGVMSDPMDIGSFLPLRQFNCTMDWQRCISTLDNAPDEGRFVAIRYTSEQGSLVNAYVDDLYVSECGAANFRVVSIESEYVVFDWTQTGTPEISIEYGPTGFARGTGTNVIVQTLPPYTLSGLNNLTDYEFFFESVCDEGGSYCTANYSDSTTIFTPSGGTGCIDPTNLTANYTTCFYGTFGNPFQNIGIINNGPSNGTSRHTVHLDTTETDPRTGGLLKTVPVGERASVRLGNWNSGGESEAITYNLFVDTSQFDLLILRYAAVLQDRLHPSTAQPRFKLEITDENGVLLDPQCGSADFIANQSLGWNLIPETFVLWKDWTTVGINMSAYHNQNVYIRLTTFDCDDGQHYGYAYFTLNCRKKNVVSEHCGVIEENRFTAPMGFAYSWYTNFSDSVFSTDQSIVIPTNDSVIYFCDCSFIEKEECYFTISAYAGTRYPLAQFDYDVTIQDCKFIVDFHNTSTISSDGVNSISPNEGCESAWWDLGNGDTVQTYNAQAIYTEPGSYMVRLISAIAGGSCTDTIDYELVLRFDSIPRISAQAEVCFGDSIVLQTENVSSCLWENGDTALALIVYPDSSSVETCRVIDINGCADTLSHSIVVNPIYDISMDSLICESVLPYTWNGFTLDTVSDSVFIYRTQSTQNCDSITRLSVHVLLTSYATVYDTVVENELPYQFNGHTYTSDSVDRVVVTNSMGCDSVIDYRLTVLWNVDTTVYDTICESELTTFSWNDSIFDSSGIKTTTLLSSLGADSTVIMNLHVHPTSYAIVNDTIVENSLPHVFQGNTYLSDTIGDIIELANAVGCDSVITYSLHVHRNTDTILYDTICESGLASFIWNDSTFSSAGSKTTTIPTIFGADSVITMNLYVIETSYSVVCDTIVENELPYSFHGNTYFSDVVFDTILLTNHWGCDSVMSYNLTVLRNVYDTVSVPVCDNAFPYSWNNLVFDGPGHQNDTLLTSIGVDSIITVNISTIPTYTFIDTVSKCQNELPYIWRDTVFVEGSESCDYLEHYTSVEGCDSNYLLRLTINPIYEIEESVVLCDNHFPYSWHDTVLYDCQVIDTFYLYRTSSANCDSVTSLAVNVNRTYRAFDTVSICDNAFPYVYHDTTLAEGTTTGQYSATLHSVHQCDSVFDLHLNVNPTHLDTVEHIACDSFTWDDGITYTSSNDTARILLNNQYQCDSVITLSLTVNHTTYGIDSVQSCEPYLWIDGNIHSTLDSAQFTIQNQFGCDSIVTLALHLKDPTETYIVDSFCTGTRYLFGGQELEAGGLYVDTLANVDMCDSIIYLTLTCLPIPEVQIEVLHDCENRQYTLRGNSSAPFFEWSVLGENWNNNWGEPNAPVVTVPGHEPIQLLFFTDYNQYPTCPNAVDTTLGVLTKPIARINVTPTIATPENNILTLLNQSYNYDEGHWYINGEYYSDEQSTTYTIPMELDSVIISLVVFDGLCTDTVTQTVEFRKASIYVPNIFTPSESTNNTFVVVMDGVLEYEIHIYNRYGFLVYHSTDMEEFWDGNDRNGNPCGTAAYVYQIRYRNKIAPKEWHTLFGSVSLVR